MNKSTIKHYASYSTVEKHLITKKKNYHYIQNHLPHDLTSTVQKVNSRNAGTYKETQKVCQMRTNRKKNPHQPTIRYYLAKSLTNKSTTYNIMHHVRQYKGVLSIRRELPFYAEQSCTPRPTIACQRFKVEHKTYGRHLQQRKIN